MTKKTLQIRQEAMKRIIWPAYLIYSKFTCESNDTFRKCIISFANMSDRNWHTWWFGPPLCYFVKVLIIFSHNFTYIRVMCVLRMMGESWKSWNCKFLNIFLLSFTRAENYITLGVNLLFPWLLVFSRILLGTTLGIRDF